VGILDKKWPLARAVVAHAPEEPGIYVLWLQEEVIYIGRAAAGGIRAGLLEHLEGRRGGCTQSATHYSWEISLWPTLRESEVLAEFVAAHKRKPRCNQGDA
jgi:hypothetical protein